MRKRDKQIAAEGQAPRIDMETLRASARAADLDKSHARAQAHASSSQTQVPPNTSTPPTDSGNPTHHQSSFQVVNMGPGSSAGSSTPASTSHSHQMVATPNDTAIAPAPPQSWVPPRVQSFMRTSQHSGSTDASPR